MVVTGADDPLYYCTKRTLKVDNDCINCYILIVDTTGLLRNKHEQGQWLALHFF